MTEKEFLKEVWRPYDTVKICNGFEGRVQNVCFKTRSVRIMLSDGMPEWFKCSMIDEHHSKTGETDDAGIIEDLHNKLLGANARIDALTEEKKRLEENLSKNKIGALLSNMNVIIESLREKKKKMERIDESLARINEIVELLKPDADVVRQEV